MARPPSRTSIAALRRRFITPEGVDLNIELGTAGARAGAFLLDGVLMLGVLILASIGLALVLDLWLPVSASFFIISGIYLLIAVVAVLVGVRVIKKVKAPTATIATAKEIPAAFRD